MATTNEPNETTPVLQSKPDEVIIKPDQLTTNNPSQIETGINDHQYDFEYESIRKRFIRRVYSLLLLQLLIVLIILAIFTFNERTKIWVHENKYMLWIAIGIFAITIILLFVCGQRIRRKKPLDIIFFIIFTIVHSFLLAFLITIGSNILLISVGISCILHIIFILFTFQFKIKFSGWFSVIIILIIVAIIFGISLIFVEGDEKFSWLYASIASTIFSFYIIFDLKLMMDDEYRYAIKPNEYFFAALNVYLDVFKIFIYAFRKIFYCLFDHPHRRENSATQTRPQSSTQNNQHST